MWLFCSFQRSVPVYSGTPGNYTPLFVTSVEDGSLFRDVSVEEVDGTVYVRPKDPFGDQTPVYFAPVASVEDFTGEWYGKF